MKLKGVLLALYMDIQKAGEREQLILSIRGLTFLKVHRCLPNIILLVAALAVHSIDTLGFVMA